MVHLRIFRRATPPRGRFLLPRASHVLISQQQQTPALPRAVPLGLQARLPAVVLPRPPRALRPDVVQRHARVPPRRDLRLDEPLVVKVLPAAEDRQVEALDERAHVEHARVAPAGGVGRADDEQLDAGEAAVGVDGADAPRLGEAVGGGHEGAQVAAGPLEVPLEVHLKGQGVGGDLVVASGPDAAPWVFGVDDAVLNLDVRFFSVCF